MNKDQAEHDSLVSMLTDAPHVNNEEIEAAIKAGLTRLDIEWNQRLGRSWLFRATDAKAETEERKAYYIANGLSEEDAVAALKEASRP